MPAPLAHMASPQPVSIVATVHADAHLVCKAHAQQAVGFIKHQGLQVFKPNQLGVSQVVNQPPLQAPAQNCFDNSRTTPVLGLE
jgi:hypothetical protein